MPASSPRPRAISVTLIDKNDYHQFQPLLYQVATSMLAARDIAYPLRKIAAEYEDFDTKRGEVVAIDPGSRTVTTRRGETYTGDYLVLAAGSQPNFFGTPGAEHAFPLYSLDDAERLKTRIIQAFEEADADPRLADEGALDFVVVGGGPTGVEVAGALSEMIHTTMLHEFPDARAARQGPPRRPRHGAAEDVLRQGPRLRGADPREGRRRAPPGDGVKAIGPGHVTLSDGSTIKTRCVIWGGGLMAAPVAGASGLPQGRGGRIDVGPDFTVAGFPGVLVIGDIANIPPRTARRYPQLGSVALQSGGSAADTILADIKGETPKPFKYLDKGTMAMIGRGAAVAQVKGVELHGKLAFAAWLGVHAALMAGGSNRVDAFESWARDFFGKDRAPEVARPQRHAPDGLGRGRRGRAVARGRDD